jgi:hypothetical protein
MGDGIPLLPLIDQYCGKHFWYFIKSPRSSVRPTVQEAIEDFTSSLFTSLRPLHICLSARRVNARIPNAFSA